MTTLLEPHEAYSKHFILGKWREISVKGMVSLLTLLIHKLVAQVFSAFGLSHGTRAMVYKIIFLHLSAPYIGVMLSFIH